jgi:hypothetical protein
VEIGPVERLASYSGTLYLLRPGQLALLDGKTFFPDPMDALTFAAVTLVWGGGASSGFVPPGFFSSDLGWRWSSCGSSDFERGGPPASCPFGGSPSALRCAGSPWPGRPLEWRL